MTIKRFGGREEGEKWMPCVEKYIDVDIHRLCVQCPVRVPKKEGEGGLVCAQNPVPDHFNEMDQKA